MLIEFMDGTNYTVEDDIWISLNWGVPGMRGCAMNKVVPKGLAQKLSEKYKREEAVLADSRDKAKKAMDARDKRAVKKAKAFTPKKSIVAKKRKLKPKASRKSSGGAIKLFR